MAESIALSPQSPTHDLAVIIVSTNEAKWLSACLTTVFAQAGDISLDVVVADNESTDGTAELVAARVPGGAGRSERNRGFSHANNRALMTCDARYVLFLNPDTEIVDGTFAELVAALDARPERRARRRPAPDRRRRHCSRRSAGFPTCCARSGRRWARSGGRFARRWSCERELDESIYEREVECDWTTGRLHDRPPRGARGRRLARRALLHLLGGDRPLLPDQGERLGGSPPAVDDDHPPRGQGRD